MKKILIFVLVAIFVSGCSITFNRGKSDDLGIFKSEDSGETWVQYVYAGRTQKKEIKIGDLAVNKIINNPDDREILYICTADRGIYKSVDGANIWQETGLKQGTFVNVAFDAKDRNILYTATDGKIYKSANAGKNWDVIYIETQPGQFITDVATDHYDARRVYASTNLGTLIKSDDYGVTWQVLNWFNTAIDSIVINPQDSRVIYIVTADQGLRKTTDKGQTWLDLGDNLKIYKGAGKINAFSFNHDNPSEYYLATDYGLIKGSVSEPEDIYNVITTLVSFGNPIDQVAIDPARPNNIYITKDNKFHISTNYGEEWKTILLPTSGHVTDVLIVPKKESNTLYLTIIK